MNALLIPRSEFFKAIKIMTDLMVDMVKDDEVPKEYRDRISILMKQYAGTYIISE